MAGNVTSRPAVVPRKLMSALFGPKNADRKKKEKRSLKITNAVRTKMH
jgi:hypothetical protein